MPCNDERVSMLVLAVDDLRQHVFTGLMATVTPSSDKLSWERFRLLGEKLTTPLLPDDYLRLVNPLWSSRELRGRVEKVIPETEDAATLVIRPGWGWHYRHRPGQYVGIGVQVGGRFVWRSYSISSPPARRGRTIAITVRAMPEGRLSSHLVSGLEPGTIVRLALPQGDFVLPDPPPAKMMFLVAGSGITPVMAMLRTLDRRGTMPDVVVHYSSPTPERMIFREELEELAERHESLTLHQLHTDTQGMLELADLDHLCPDWRDRDTWACGPAPMLDAINEHFSSADLEEQLHLERFSLDLAGDADGGGTVTFRNSGKTIEVDGATTVLEAGEKAGVGMPYGCRMGICHTCTVTLVSGAVRDLRSGTVSDQPNEQVQTCITAVSADCVLDI
jgi:ferredoxin-NADP reductase